MTPIAFGGCFGWLHELENRTSGDVAVLICPPLGYDTLPSYGSLRLLADELAAAGYPALRFDYPATGDSCDEEVERAGGYLPAWSQSMNAAADWLRATTGARRIVLCAMRGSALLAVPIAAERDDVIGLLLLAPVVRGHSFMRQLFFEAQLQSGHDTPPSEGLVFREFRFNPATVASISKLDLREVNLRAGQKVAICTHSEARVVDECSKAWTAAGADVANLGWIGLEPLLRQNIIEEDSLADFSGVLAWLRRVVPSTAAQSSADGAITPVELRPSGCIETPLQFGTGNRLFGVLCRPEHGTSDTVVIIGNGGRDPHYGAARHAVILARRLAQAGVASFRMDFAGLGDSLGPVGSEHILSSMFGTDRTADIVAALDTLERQGFRRFAMTGLCAGAYHAFVAALTDPRLSILLLINMPFFTMPDGSAIDYLTWREMTPSDLLHRMPRAKSWRKLIEHRREIGALVRVILMRWHDRTIKHVKELAITLGMPKQPTFAERALGGLCARDVRTLFLFSQGDHGVDDVERELKRPGPDLGRHYPGVAWHVFPGMDHDLSNAAGREPAEAVMIDFVTA